MIGEDRWQSACDHVDKVIGQMKRHDHYMDNMKEKFVNNLTDDTSNDSSTDTASQGSTTDNASEINWNYLYFELWNWYNIKRIEKKTKKKYNKLHAKQ